MKKKVNHICFASGKKNRNLTSYKRLWCQQFSSYLGLWGCGQMGADEGGRCAVFSNKKQLEAETDAFSEKLQFQHLGPNPAGQQAELSSLSVSVQ